MKRHLPPLNSLRAFEAAARHQSFKKAAEELFVTSGAISRQVQVLEDHLGTSLFTRMNREVIITAEGEQYRNSLTKAFDQINTSTQDFKKERKLMVSSYFTFAMKWLIPRMESFTEQYSKYPIALSTTIPSLADVTSGTVDIALMGGAEDSNWPGVVAYKLFPFITEPVISPELSKRLPIEAPEDLSKTTLLHSAARPDDWSYWLEQSEVNSVSPYSGLTFDNSVLSFHAAIKSMGAAIGQTVLLTEELENGSLIRPFNKPQHDGAWYYLAYSKKLEHHRPVVQFRDWMLEEADKFKKQYEGMI